MNNSDRGKIPCFICCFPNQLSILNTNKRWFTWNLLKAFQTEASITTNAKYERQTKQTSFFNCSRLCICFSKSVMREVVWFSNHVLSTPSQINNLHYFSCSACEVEHTDVCLSAFPVQHTNIFLPQRTRSLTQCLSKQTLFITTEHSCNSDFIYITFFRWVKPHIQMDGMPCP